jgi:hypothetical protein
MTTDRQMAMCLVGILVVLHACGCASIDWQQRVQDEINKVIAQQEIVIPVGEKPEDASTSSGLKQDPAFKSSKMHTAPQSVADWVPVSKLTVERFRGSLMRLNVDDETRKLWPTDVSMNILCTLQDSNGQWHTAPCDWVRPLPSVKEIGCLNVCDGDTRVMEPQKGKLVGITLSSKCRHTPGKDKLLSTTVWLTVNW